MLRDPEVEIVYVATPHPFHHQHVLQCLDAGKAVLCEKPIAVNELQAREMVARARERKLFLMEAMWTRALPVMRQVGEWLDDGRIGAPRMLTADFGFRTRWNPEGRLLNPALAGGATLDVGVYVVALAYMVFGSDPVSVRALAHLGETGIDEQTALILRYDDGALALLSCAVRTDTPQMARIDGTEGRIEIPRFWQATSATLEAGTDSVVTTRGEAGYHFEAEEAMSCLREGRTESSLIPLDESLRISRILDQVRAQIGLVYPTEKAGS
jgi:predicted dehydrogenase